MSTPRKSRITLTPFIKHRQTLKPTKAFANVLQESQIMNQQIPATSTLESSSKMNPIKDRLRNFARRLSNRDTFQNWRVTKSSMPTTPLVTFKPNDTIEMDNLESSHQVSLLAPCLVDYNICRKRCSQFTSSFDDPTPLKTSRLIASLDIQRSPNFNPARKMIVPSCSQEHISRNPTKFLAIKPADMVMKRSESVDPIRVLQNNISTKVYTTENNFNDYKPPLTNEISSSTTSASSLGSFTSSANSADFESSLGRSNLKILDFDSGNGSDRDSLRTDITNGRELFLQSVPSTDSSWILNVYTNAGVTLFNINPVNGIKYLLKNKVVGIEPKSIIAFLSSQKISRLAMGEYFGSLSDPLASQVVNTLINNMEMKGLEIDEALRALMKIFHPSGESQKISSLVTMFRKAYVKQNAKRVGELFLCEETVEIMAYSILMLHTGLHNPNALKAGKPMTVDEFIKNNRGIDAGNDSDHELQQKIYERVAESRFATDSDLTDVIRELDKLITGPLKTEMFIQRHRRFVGWTLVQELHEVPTKLKGSSTKSNGHIRALFIFNDMILVTKPNQFTFKMSYFQSIPPTTSPMSHSSYPKPWSSSSPIKIVHSQTEMNLNTLTTSTKPPTNGNFLIKSVISLKDLSVVLFTSRTAKQQFAMQLCDNKRVLINVAFQTEEDRKQIADWINLSAAEYKEVLENK